MSLSSVSLLLVFLFAAFSAEAVVRSTWLCSWGFQYKASSHPHISTSCLSFLTIYFCVILCAACCIENRTRSSTSTSTWNQKWSNDKSTIAIQLLATQVEAHIFYNISRFVKYFFLFKHVTCVSVFYYRTCHAVSFRLIFVVFYNFALKLSYCLL